jgi:hypothetical protein
MGSRAQDQEPLLQPDIKPVPPRPGYEDSLHYADTFHIHYAFATTGVISDANSVSSYIFTNMLKLSLLSRATTVNWINSYVYGKSAGLLTNNDFNSTLDVNLYESIRHFYYWALGSYTSSYSLAINAQEQIAAGIGYNIIDKKKDMLLVSDGPLYEVGNLYDSLYGGTVFGDVYQHDQYQVVRNSFHLLYHVTTHNIFSFDGSFFMQNAFNDFSDYILKLNLGMSVKLNKWLSFTTTYLYNKFTRTNTRNQIFNVGLSIAR